MVKQVFLDLLRSYKESKPHADPRTKDWLLVYGSPTYVILLSIAYVVYVKWLGPWTMRHREAMDLKGLMVIYNFFLVGLSAYMSVEIYLSSYDAGYGVFCAPYNTQSQDPTDEKEMRVANVLWWYFFSKVIEFMDTVFMVLRKKDEQITFLHVFHHTSMLNIWWWVMTFIPGGLSYFGAAANSAVHVIMYLYYGLAAIPAARPYLWWKKYITKIQLAQFCIVFVHSVTTIFNQCDFPTWGKYLLSGYVFVLFFLFMNFYIHAYRRKNKGGAREHQKNNRLSNGHAAANGKTNGHQNNNHKTD